MKEWTWTEQPLNDRQLRPPTFTELYFGEMIYFSFTMTIIILSLIITTISFRKNNKI